MSFTNPNRAKRIIDFIETLRCPDGSDVGQLLRLRPWQCDIVRRVYEPASETGLLLTRQAVLSMPRKNGKTALDAAITMAHLCGPEAVLNGQLYSVAYDREQASILFKYMASMIRMDEELSSRLNIVESRKKIIDPISGSEFSALSSETKGKHGKSPSLIIFDELAQYGSDRELYDVMMTGRGAHKEPLVWVISTQAPDDGALLSELIDYGKRINSGQINDPAFVLVIYEAAPDADIWDESVWKACNPALEDFCNIEILRDEAEKARRMPSAEATFRNLRCNQRIDATEHFVSPSVWKACGGEVDISVFDDVECYGGLDLSGKNDLTALVFVAEDAQAVWQVLSYFWTPGDNLRDREDRDRAPYTVWRDQGYLEAKPGKTIDYGWVARKIAKLNGILNIAGIRFDRWRIDDLQRELIDAGVACWIEGKDWKPESGSGVPDGLRLTPHGQGFRDMNPAVEILEDALIEQRIRHGMHPVLTWCASNTRIQSDPAGNRKFDKLKSTGRIDGMQALSMALNGAVGDVATAGERSFWEN